MRWSRAYEDCDDVPSKPRDGLVWWSPPVESSCEAQVEELHWTERVVTRQRSGTPYVHSTLNGPAWWSHSMPP